MLSTWWCFSFLTAAVCMAQSPSPCPGQFQYEAKNESPGRWDGTLTLLTDYDLFGIWIRLIFDIKSKELTIDKNLGEVVTSNNVEYLIKNRDYILKSGVPTKIPISVKYEGDKVPSLIGYRLNGKIVCPEQSSNVSWVDNNKKPNSNEYFLGDLHNKDFLETRPAFPTSISNCGTTPLFSNEKLKGQKTVEGQWPWQASINLKTSDGERYICGATLISPTSLLTAAHCVIQKNSDKPVGVDLLQVHLGKFLVNGGNQGEQLAKVQEIILHPGYNSRTLRNDIAVIKLTKAIIISDYVRPICLSQEVNDNEIIRRRGVVAGNGFDNQKRFTESLTQAHLFVESDEDCIDDNPDLEIYLNDKNFCANFIEENPICVGDSGNGFMLLKEGQKPVWELEGIVSVGLALQNKFVCDGSSSIIVTDVSKYLKWIQANMI